MEGEVEVELGVRKVRRVVSSSRVGVVPPRAVVAVEVSWLRYVGMFVFVIWE